MAETLVPAFSRSNDDPAVTRIGGGVAGGKALGLAALEQKVLPAIDHTGLEGISYVIPRAAVIATDVFDAFIKHNNLVSLAQEVAREERSEVADERVRQAFVRASFPPLAVGDLRSLLEFFREPLAIRSSSLLEDALEHPFAGVYGTKMVPNNQGAMDARFRELITALKFVYATTYFAEARAYRHALGGQMPDEKMAVVVQRIAGRRHGERFYPCISGVGRSFNYYATGHAQPEDGVVSLALGLGKTIVDGGASWTYCPAYPKAPPPVNDIGTLLNASQRHFWAVHLGKPPVVDPMQETEYMLQHEVSAAQQDGVLAPLVSTFDAANDRLVPGLRPRGGRVLDFAPLLQFELAPFNEAISRLLRAAERLLGCAVEIEFAYSYEPGSPEEGELSILQARPMRVEEQALTLDDAALEGPGLLVASRAALGNGVRDDIQHVLYLKPDAFDPAHSRAIAAEIATHNRALVEGEHPYLLIGFGRWGSSDPWLGVPVQWSDIGGARAIVETTSGAMNPELSQGSHFFHNMLSFGVLYFSVRHDLDVGVDWSWLDALPALVESKHVRLVRCPRPLSLRVDGRHRLGVIDHG
ncbi:MAG: hypothetical protein JRH20_04495 [Deltaproteobacteria bacterium]|nr:hypothetical protein [Deltaproteobacteria bacterium]